MWIFALLAWEPYTGEVAGLPYQLWPALEAPVEGLLYETGSGGSTGGTFGAAPELPATPQHQKRRSSPHHAFTVGAASPVVVELPGGFRPSSSALVVRLTPASSERAPRVRAINVQVLHDGAPALAAARARFEKDLAAAPLESRGREVCARMPPSSSPPIGAYDEGMRRYDSLTTWASLPTWNAASRRIEVTFVARRLEQVEFVWTTASGCVDGAPCAQDPGGEYYVCGVEMRARYEIDLDGTVTEHEVLPLTEVWHATRAP